jgi:hypothetical protein
MDHSSKRHVVVIGRSPAKMRQALQVLESAGFAATGTFSRDEGLAAITAQHRLFAVVAGGSVDREAEAELRAAAQAKGGQVVRANIGDGDPTQHFIDHVLPQLERLRSTARSATCRSRSRSSPRPVPSRAAARGGPNPHTHNSP